MKRNILFLLIILFFFNSYSQPNIRPGYIVDLSGKVINGFINYQNWEFNPHSITFGETADKVTTICTPHEIRSFAVGGELYESHIVQVNTGPRDLYELGFSPEIKTRNDTAFVRLLIGGPQSLYFLSVKAGRENFYIGNNGDLELLLFQNYLKVTDDLSSPYMMISNNKYIGQLTLYLQECNNIQEDLKNVKYNQTSLVKLFKAYYNCKGATMEYEEPVVKRKPDYGCFAGLSMSKLYLKGGLLTNYSDVQFPTSLTFTAGAYYNIILGRSLGKWSINNELQYAYFNTTGTRTEVTTAYHYVNTTLDFKYSYVKLNNMIRYTRPVRDFYVYLEAGISNGLAIRKENRRTEVSVFYQQITTSKGDAIESVRDHEQSLLFGAGLKYRNFGAAYRIESGNGMSNMRGINSKVISQRLLFYYRIGRPL